MSSLTVYSSKKSARLIYVLDWLFKDVLNIPYVLTEDVAMVSSLPFYISYGAPSFNAVSIPDCGLLWEENIQAHQTGTGTWNNTPVLYPVPSDCTLPFDLFSALFFLITRYEEYYDYTPDKHGRYPVTACLLYRQGWLERPLIDEWVFEFYLLLKKYQLPVSLNAFTYQPTYDIDIAYSYRCKGFIRTTGALAKDLLKGNFKDVRERLFVLQRKKKDPYDSFEWLSQMHHSLHVPALYFVLASLHTTRFDKNISPLHPEMQKLIKGFSREGTPGMHPSYFSSRQEIFLSEKEVLEKISAQKIHQSRQHYIRLHLPQTYYDLSARGIREDWSMGFGSKSGFRAGTGRSFFWYDLQGERPTLLRVHPFCFMDSTAHFEEGLTAEEAFNKLREMYLILKQTHSRLVTVFHNFSLGTDPQWRGWKEAYYRFLKEAVTA